MGASSAAFPDEIVLTQHAIAATDDDLMRAIIEENVHQFRNKTLGVGAEGISGALVQAEETVVDELVDTIFDIGRPRGWW